MPKVPKARDTHSEYVVLIAFLLQQWLHKHSWMLRYSTLPVLLIIILTQDDGQSSSKN